MKTWTITDDKNIKTSEILVKLRKHFPVYVHDEKDIDKQFPPPSETVEVSFRQRIESDEEHKNKSCNDFMSEKDRVYMTARQYLLLFLHVFEKEGKHLDRKGWTRTSSLWADGSLVCGRWFPGSGRFYLSFGCRGFRLAVDGPREQINLRTLSSLPSESDLDQAIEKVKEAGYVIYKVI